MAHTKKRKVNSVPKLIDNKRKHLQEKLSAAQRDELLIKEAKEDALFGKELAEAMQESTQSCCCSFFFFPEVLRVLVSL